LTKVRWSQHVAVMMLLHLSPDYHSLCISIAQCLFRQRKDGGAIRHIAYCQCRQNEIFLPQLSDRYSGEGCDRECVRGCVEGRMGGLAFVAFMLSFLTKGLKLDAQMETEQALKKQKN